MKHILRLDENDILKIIQERFDVRKSQVTAVYEDNDDETKFYVEIEKDEK